MDKNRLEEIKKSYKSKDGKELTDKEAADIEIWMRSFANLLIDHAQTHFRRKNKLKQNPKGFEMEEESYYSCPICTRTMEGTNFWYDKHGMKCKDCQRMLDTKVIPLKVLKNRNCWMSDWQVCDKLKIHPATRDKMVRNKELEITKLTDSAGVVYFNLFCKSKNKKLPQ